MNRRTKIKFPVFNGYEVRVIISADVRRTARRLGADDGPCVAFFIAGEKKGWLVLPKTVDAGTIAHEASHAVAALLSHAGVRRDEETFAYHLDFLVGGIHKFIQRSK